MIFWKDDRCWRWVFGYSRRWNGGFQDDRCLPFFRFVWYKFYLKNLFFDEENEKFDEENEKFDEEKQKFDEENEKFDEEKQKFDEEKQKFDEEKRKFDEEKVF